MNGEFFVINEAAGDNFDYSNLRIVEHKKKTVSESQKQ